MYILTIIFFALTQRKKTNSMTNQILKTLVFAVLLFNYSVGTAQDIALEWAKGMEGGDRL